MLTIMQPDYSKQELHCNLKENKTEIQRKHHEEQCLAEMKWNFYFVMWHPQKVMLSCTCHVLVFSVEVHSYIRAKQGAAESRLTAGSICRKQMIKLDGRNLTNLEKISVESCGSLWHQKVTISNKCCLLKRETQIKWMDGKCHMWILHWDL